MTTSKPRVASPFQSDSIVTPSTPSVATHDWCDQGESREIAKVRMPAASRSSRLSRRSSISFVHPVDQSNT